MGAFTLHMSHVRLFDYSKSKLENKSIFSIPQFSGSHCMITIEIRLKALIYHLLRVGIFRDCIGKKLTRKVSVSKYAA